MDFQESISCLSHRRDFSWVLCQFTHSLKSPVCRQPAHYAWKTSRTTEVGLGKTQWVIQLISLEGKPHSFQSQSWKPQTRWQRLWSLAALWSHPSCATYLLCDLQQLSCLGHNPSVKWGTALPTLWWWCENRQWWDEAPNAVPGTDGHSKKVLRVLTKEQKVGLPWWSSG